jgi:glutaredoxin
VRRVTLYTRRGCHLCDDAKAALDRVHARMPFTLEVVDVDGDPALAEAYGLEVPVVLVDGRKHAKYRLDERAFAARLAAPAADGEAG